VNVRRLWNVTERLNVLHPDNWSAVVEQLLERYAHEVYSGTRDEVYEGTRTRCTRYIQEVYALDT